MVNLAHSPLLEKAERAPPPAPDPAPDPSQHARRAAAVACTSVLHHQIVDFKRRRLHELHAGVGALQQIVGGALEGSLQQVRHR